MPKYRIDKNADLVPTAEPLLQAEDLIETQGVFHLYVLHVLVPDESPRRAFMPSIRVGGLTVEKLAPHYGDGEDAYQGARSTGLALLARKIREVSGNAVPVT